MKLGELFQSIKDQKLQNEKEAVTQAEEKEPVKETLNEEELLFEASVLPEVESDLLEVWKRWAGSRFPPLLSLAGHGDPFALGMDQDALERERAALAIKLNQSARLRLRAIREEEKKWDEFVKQLREKNPEQTVELEPNPMKGRCECFLSKDRMIAWLFCYPPIGQGVFADREAAEQALAEQGVTSGIDPEAVEAAIRKEQVFQLLPVAFGVRPVEGKNGEIRERFPREVVRKVSVDENGDADYRAANYVQIIQEGDRICEIIPPVEGRSGQTVQGKDVAAKSVRAAHVPRGSHTQISEDGRYLVAAQAGHLEYVNEGFQVRPVLEINSDVDYSTGNIDFPGDVHIHGDVRENFQVCAKGNVVVDGIVEAATIAAGGDLLISRGVVGDERAMLRCKGTLRVKFLESCTVYAKGSVYADSIITSQVYSDETICVTSGRGSIIGGALSAARMIQAKLLGARSGRETLLTLGELPNQKFELDEAAEELERIQTERAKLEKDLRYLKQRAAQGGENVRLAKARLRKSALDVREKQLNQEMERCQDQLPDLSRCRIECETAFPITKVVLGESILVIDTVRQHLRVSYDEREQELKEIF